MKILVPIGEGRKSLAAIDFVASRKALVGRDPDVFVLHAHWPLPRAVVRAVGRGPLRQIQDRSAERVLKPALQSLAAAELVTRSINATGEPGEAIVSAAKKHRVDLIVSGPSQAVSTCGDHSCERRRRRPRTSVHPAHQRSRRRRRSMRRM